MYKKSLLSCVAARCPMRADRRFVSVCGAIAVMAFAASLAAPETLLAAQLVADWQFSEGTGTVAYDSSGHGHDASMYSDAGYPRWGAGAMGFDGNAARYARLVCTNMPSFSDSFSATARFRITGRRADNACSTIVSKWGGGNYMDDEWALSVIHDAVGANRFKAELCIHSPETMDQVVTSSDWIDYAQEWHTVTAYFDAGHELAIAVDGGGFDRVPTIATHTRIGPWPLWIGNRNYWTNNWHPVIGDIDSVQLYTGVVPEPSAPLALATGALALLGYVGLRRKRPASWVA